MVESAGNLDDKRRNGLAARHVDRSASSPPKVLQPEKSIGVIASVTVDFFRDILRGIREYCNQHPGTKMDLISESGYHPHMNVDGRQLDCIVAQISDAEHLAELRRICPHVVVTSNRRILPDCPRVLSDDLEVGRMGARYLHSLGYRTLAILTAGNYRFSEERRIGFSEAAAGLGVEVHVFEGKDQAKLTGHIGEMLSLPGPVGLMAVSDLHARWLIEEMPAPDEIVPNRIAILGVDNDSLQNSLSPIGISSIQLSGQRIGYEAAALGMQLSRSGSFPGEPLRIAPRNVVSRRSTDKLAISDKLVARAMTLMRERMADIHDAGDLVRIMDVPRRTLEVRFRKAAHTTPASELANCRIRRARELLSTTDLSIKEIAFLVGFSEPRMLSLVFKRVAGELPSDYRARVRPGG